MKQGRPNIVLDGGDDFERGVREEDLAEVTGKQNVKEVPRMSPDIFQAEGRRRGPE